MAGAAQTCMKCVHHFITYDPKFPYGCRAMNFKIRVLPGLEVKSASGLDCQMFQRRAENSRLTGVDFLPDSDANGMQAPQNSHYKRPQKSR